MPVTWPGRLASGCGPLQLPPATADGSRSRWHASLHRHCRWDFHPTGLLQSWPGSGRPHHHGGQPAGACACTCTCTSTRWAAQTRKGSSNSTRRGRSKPSAARSEHALASHRSGRRGRRHPSRAAPRRARRPASRGHPASGQTAGQAQELARGERGHMHRLDSRSKTGCEVHLHGRARGRHAPDLRAEPWSDRRTRCARPPGAERPHRRHGGSRLAEIADYFSCLGCCLCIRRHLQGWNHELVAASLLTSLLPVATFACACHALQTKRGPPALAYSSHRLLSVLLALRHPMAVQSSTAVQSVLLPISGRNTECGDSLSRPVELIHQLSHFKVLPCPLELVHRINCSLLGSLAGSNGSGSALVILAPPGLSSAGCSWLLLLHLNSNKMRSF